MKYCFLLLGLLAGLMVFSRPGQAQTGASPWELVASPNLSAEHNVLLGVASVTSSDIWAVGNYDADPDPYRTDLRTLVEHWDGTQWSVVPSPNVDTGWNSLEAVEAISANNVWAVGYWSTFNGASRALIEHWDGTVWRAVSAPMPEGGAGLSALTVVSANDIWAAGFRKGLVPEQSIVSYLIHWDGSTWTEFPSPNIGDFRNFWYGIDAVSANDVWVVGQGWSHLSNLQTMAAHWDGTRWRLITTPNGAEGGELTGVAAIASNDVWLTGLRYDNGTAIPLFLHWNGTILQMVVSPGGGQTTRAVASNDIWSVGNGTVHWNGVEWQSVPTAPVPNSIGDGFFGLAIISPSEVWTVGRYYTADNGIFTLTERFITSPQTVKLSGIITLPGVVSSQSQSLTLEFRAAGFTPITRTISLAANGAFNLNGIPARHYNLAIKGSKWLQKVVPLDATSGNIPDFSVALLPGDANNDNCADIRDLVLLIAHYNQTSSGNYLEAADFNSDGSNDLSDLLLLINNYNAQGDS